MIGWMIQYSDDGVHWEDYQWTDNPKERDRMVRWLKISNFARAVPMNNPDYDERDV